RCATRCDDDLVLTIGGFKFLWATVSNIHYLGVKIDARRAWEGDRLIIRIKNMLMSTGFNDQRGRSTPPAGDVKFSHRYLVETISLEGLGEQFCTFSFAFLSSHPIID